MPTNYPASNDSFTDPTATQPTNAPSHAAQHTNINDAMVAVQTAVGNTGTFKFVLVGAAAGGDLAGTYPSPSLATVTSAQGPTGDSGHVPVITIDAKGRVTALTTAAIGGGPPSGSAGGDLSGTYPNPGVAKVNGIAISSGTATLLSQFTAPVGRTASGTAAAGEETVITGTTGAQTVTLPSAPQSGTMNEIVNESTQNWTIAAGAGDTLNFFGTVGSVTLAPKQSLQLVYLASGTVWHTVGFDFINVGGDISGTVPSPTVVKVQGVSLSSANANIMAELGTTHSYTASATVAAGEYSVFTGSASAQTITLPASTSQVGTVNTVLNLNSNPITVGFGTGTTLNTFGNTAGTYSLASNASITYVLVGTVWYALDLGYSSIAGGDLAGTLPSPTLADTANVENIARTGVTQAARRRGSSAWDNVLFGVQPTTTVAAASDGVNVSTFSGSGTLNVTPIPVGTFADQVTHVTAAPLMISTSVPVAQILYTGVTISGGNITAFTGCTTLAGASGALSGTGATPTIVYGPPQAEADVVVCADSILYEQGSNIPNQNVPGATTGWWDRILARESRLAGLPDPGRGWRRAVNAVFTADQWNNLSGGANAAGSVGPSTNATVANCYNTTSLNNVIGDTFAFRRAVVHIQGVTNGDGVQVSFNGGSSFTSTIDTNLTAVPGGLITVDSGDLGSVQQRVIQVKQVAHVTGSGGGGVIVCGYLAYQTDGTNGIVGYNFGQAATTTANWITPTGWDTIWLPYIQPRRIYMMLGLNDLNTSVSIQTVQVNLTTLVSRAQKASPLSEIVLCAPWHAGSTVNSFNTGITNANWYNQMVSMINTICFQLGVTFVDASTWFGDAAIWTVASVTTVTATASATVASGGFPNVENGMVVTGVGMPPPINPVKVSSIVGNTVNFSGNTAAIVGGTQTLTFTNDTLGISAQDGVHFGDQARSSSGRDAQQALAEMFWENLTFNNMPPPVAAGPGWSIDFGGYPLGKAAAIGRQWTRTANTTFTMNYPTSLVGIYTAGTKLRWAESGTVKYGIVQSSSFSASTLLTTVTMATNATYVMAANPDTGSNWISYGSPAGFPIATFASTTVMNSGTTFTPYLAGQYRITCVGGGGQGGGGSGSATGAGGGGGGAGMTAESVQTLVAGTTYTVAVGAGGTGTGGGGTSGNAGTGGTNGGNSTFAGPSSTVTAIGGGGGGGGVTSGTTPAGLWGVAGTSTTQVTAGVGGVSVANVTGGDANGPALMAGGGGGGGGKAAANGGGGGTAGSFTAGGVHGGSGTNGTTAGANGSGASANTAAGGGGGGCGAAATGGTGGNGGSGYVIISGPLP